MRHLPIPVADLATILEALGDAADCRREYEFGDCAGCDGQADGLCGDHAADEEKAREFDALAAMLRRDRRPRLVNDGFFGGLWAYFAPAGWATQWYWPAGRRGRAWNLLHGRGWRES